MAKRKRTDRAKPYEGLGAFYLGRRYDIEAGAVLPESLLYDAKDLTTHAVCVGMTGSGKTGLCLSLLEEAAIDGIPAIAIDPKGDLGNLLLTFPELRASDFRPWIDPGAAGRAGMEPDEYATTIAKRWREGLAEWDQDGSRIQRLRRAADFAIYTPGSGAGLPLTVLRSFAAPPPALADDADAFRERVSAAASGLLALIGVDADPIKSREHILVSTILDRAWREQRDVDVASLIAEVQSPSFAKIGVMDIETFFPERDRFELSMRLNNLLASPGFAGWMTGEPLDVSRLLWTEEGRPRVAILSIAHLSEAERMFFVTILLNEVIAWMRMQPGTSTLRAMLYMDEVFGFFPPTANPPAKTPMLTLLKQARAYGLGVVLATQNPVDLDYKGLSNTGTWFLGRLQTERDKKRVLEGLEGASATAGASFDRQRLEAILAGLDSRVFLMNNVHEDGPVLFHTRWVMSYLRGPLTRDQIQTLMADRKDTAAPVAPKAVAAEHAERVVPGQSERPVVPRGVDQTYLEVTEEAPENARLLYRPALLGVADLHFAEARSGLDQWNSVTYLAPLAGKIRSQVWTEAEQRDTTPDTIDTPDDDATFAKLPKPALQSSSYTAWKKQLKTHLYRDQRLMRFACPALKLRSTLEETEAQFRVRVREAAREKRDVGVEKLRKRYTPKLARLQGQITRAEERVAREQSQYGQQKLQTAISVGATVLGALLGRKMASRSTLGKATTAMRGAGRAAREREDIGRARRRVEELQERLIDLEAEFEDERAALEPLADPGAFEIQEKPLRPRKADINITRCTLAWVPHWVDADGGVTPAG